MEDIQTKFAIIGGSSTFSINFPQDIEGFDLEVLDVFTPETPFGKCPKLTLFEIKTREGKLRHALTVKMHGWMRDIPRFEASKRLFWFFSEARVERIFSEGGVGAISPLLDLRDVVIPTDFIDFSKSNVSIGGGKLLIMRDPFCPEIRSTLEKATVSSHFRVFNRGVYLSTEGQRFESAAEIAMARDWGADYVGQSAVPEVYLAREVGACYAGAHLVVNYAEGVVKPWHYEEFKDIFYKEAKLMGKILLETLIAMPEERSCSCKDYTKDSLLSEGGSEPPSRT